MGATIEGGASDGAIAELPDSWRDPAELIRRYRAMVLTRTFDAKAIALQRTGRLGTSASSLGQEAVSVGVGAAMAGDDVLARSFREQGAQVVRGVPPAPPKILPLSLTFDHRVVTGGEAARFLAAVIADLEAPT